MTDAVATKWGLTEAAVEYREDRAYHLLQDYVEALHAAQASHEAFDWIRAGSIFKRYAAAISCTQEPLHVVD